MDSTSFHELVAARDVRVGDHVWLNNRLRLVQEHRVFGGVVDIRHGEGWTVLGADVVLQRRRPD